MSTHNNYSLLEEERVRRREGEWNWRDVVGAAGGGVGVFCTGHVGQLVQGVVVGYIGVGVVKGNLDG